MAVLAFGLVGAGIGGSFGYAALGWAIGTTLGRYLFPNTGPDVTQEGPRLGDLSVSASTYGRMINIGYGTVRLSGNIIWSSGLVERSTDITQTGGKGFLPGGQSVTGITYSYYASFAIAFSEGTADALLRMWADGKLIYDNTGGDLVSAEDVNFDFYPGSETQTANPLIEANVGAGNCPGHRGLCYAVFNQLPLANYGNRIPNITAEITFNGATSQPETDTTFLPNGDGWQRFYPDLTRGTIYFTDTGPPSRIERADISTMNQVAQNSDSSLSNAILRCVLPSGYLLINKDSGNNLPVCLVDPNSLTVVDTFGTASGGIALMSTTGFGVLSDGDCCGASCGAKEFALCFSGVQMGILGTTNGSLGYLWDTNTALGGSITEAAIEGAVAGVAPTAAECVFYVLAGPSYSGASSSNLVLYSIVVEESAIYDTVAGTTGVTFTQVGTMAPSDFVSTATQLSSCIALALDQNDSNLIFFVRDNADSQWYLTKINVADATVVWATAVDTPPNANTNVSMNHSRITNNRIAWINGTTTYAYDTRDGSLIEQQTGWTSGGAGSGDYQFYDDEKGIVISEYTGNGIRKYSLYRDDGGGALLSSVVSDLCSRAGLASSWYDVSELTDTVLGYVISRQTTIRLCLEQLRTPYFFNAVESDNKVKFPKIGASVVAAIPQADLAIMDDKGNYWDLTRGQDVDLPRRVSLGYMDKDLDYQTGLQQARRISNPFPTMWSGSEQSIEVPIVFHASTPKIAAQRMLYDAWVARDRYKTRLGWKYLRLDPADVVTVTLNNGSVYRVRLATLENVGATMALNVDAVGETPAAYSSSLSADGGQGVPKQTISAVDITKLFVLDVPLLRDEDAAADSLSRYYYAEGQYNASVTWPGAYVYRAPDNQTYSVRAHIISGITWGAAVTALGDTSSPFATDEANAVTISLRVGTVESVTQSEMVNGANAALLGNEIIKFRDVSANTDGTYTLSGLLRGRRGTDTQTGTHSAGERFLVLNAAAMARDTIPQSALNTSYTYKGATAGGNFADADTQIVSLTGSDLKPYAPVHASRVDSGGDITFSWVRRTRVGGGLRAYYSSVPLSETIESYEVDILASAAASSAIRTLTASTTTVTYTSAQIASDFGSVPSRGTLNVKIFQKSAEIGRGYSYVWSL